MINPTQLERDLFTTDYETIQPYLVEVLSAEKSDEETRERAIAAAGMVKAADLLASKYTLVITNVPYLGRGKQNELLKDNIDQHYKDGKADLATASVQRCIGFCRDAGTAAIVTPQNWLFLAKYRKLRVSTLEHCHWNFVVRLGAGAFETISGQVVNVALLVHSVPEPANNHTMSCIDVSTAKQPSQKAALLLGSRSAPIVSVSQARQLANPGAVIIIEKDAVSTRLSRYADCYLGICTGDFAHFGRLFWEVSWCLGGWEVQRTTADRTTHWGGMTNALLWEGGHGRLWRSVESRLGEGNSGTWLRGANAWGRAGVAVKQMGSLPVSIYSGELYDNNVAVLVPKDPAHLLPIWTFCSSSDFNTQVRKINQALAVDTQYFLACPFDLAHWQKIALEKYPQGLPDPESDDPTQWLFHGRPEQALTPSPSPKGRGEAVLQVAVARLLGYRWPAELDEKMLLSKRARDMVKRCDELLPFADDGGIMCIPSVRGEEPAGDRLLAILATCGIETGRVRELTGGANLDDWLRNSFFEEHCKLFHDRPFIWHLWDGRKHDGFHVLVNYHKMAEGDGKGRKLLETLTYSYLGEWITRQKDGVKQGEGGAEDRLAAALELQKRLEAILEGEPPFDIFVRWKPLHQQPIGWEPDINDGVRLNIRPFLASDLPNGKKGAGILRYKPNIKWGKDRGKEPQRPKDDYPWFWGWDENHGLPRR